MVNPMEIDDQQQQMQAINLTVQRHAQPINQSKHKTQPTYFDCNCHF